MIDREATIADAVNGETNKAIARRWVSSTACAAASPSSLR
jgi:hypothetical protein